MIPDANDFFFNLSNGCYVQVWYLGLKKVADVSWDDGEKLSGCFRFGERDLSLYAGHSVESSASSFEFTNEFLRRLICCRFAFLKELELLVVIILG